MIDGRHKYDSSASVHTPRLMASDPLNPAPRDSKDIGLNHLKEGNEEGEMSSVSGKSSEREASDHNDDLGGKVDVVDKAGDSV